MRGETGYFTPKRFLTTDLTDDDGYVKKDYLQSLVGVDTTFAGINFSTQVMHQFIVDHDDELEQDEHMGTFTVRLSRSFLREKLIFDVFSYIGVNEPDALLKVGITVAPIDAFSFRVEGNFFFGESGQFGSYEENDLIVLSTRFSF